MGRLDDADRVIITSAADWRAWLAEHGESSTGVWVLIPRTHSSARGDLYAPLVEEALCFGWIDGTAGSEPEHAKLWFAPRSPRSAWAASNKERVTRLTAAGRMTPAGQRLIDTARENGMWQVLEGPEAGIEPAPLTAALDAEPAARAFWSTLPPSARKAALTQIALARTEPTRERRVATVVAACAAGKRPA